MRDPRTHSLGTLRRFYVSVLAPLLAALVMVSCGEELFITGRPPLLISETTALSEDVPITIAGTVKGGQTYVVLLRLQRDVLDSRAADPKGWLLTDKSMRMTVSAEGTSSASERIIKQTAISADYLDFELMRFDAIEDEVRLTAKIVSLNEPLRGIRAKLYLRRPHR